MAGGIPPLLTLVLLLPALGALYCVFLGDALPRRLCGVVASAAVGLAALCALLAILQLNALPPEERFLDVVLYDWIVAGGQGAPLGLLYDPLSATMALVVTGVGFLIHVYATAYMLEDMGGYRRFFAYMNIFIVAMLVLVLADNFLLLMVGWGGVGFASYALIAFYFDDRKTHGEVWPADELPPSKSGVKAFVTNMVGDVGLMLAVAVMFDRFSSVRYEDVFSRFGPVAGTREATLIALLLLAAAIAKSGQIPLHVWLPDAMTGPTPVSALIHAATMVTAGVYLIARAHPIFVGAPAALGLVALIGAVTAIFAATIGLVQPNLKRVLAYSTVSQLGYMFLAVGVGAFAAGIFHLVTHAFFKAVLFLAAGSVIHALHGEENMERMGGLRHALPLTYWSFLAGALALSAIPPFAGFFSKDEILAAAFNSGGAGLLLGLIGLVTAGLTGFYTLRAVIKTFHGAPRWPQGAHPHEAPMTMALPVLVLAVLSLIGGLLNWPTETLGNYLEPVFGRYVHAAQPAAAVAIDPLVVGVVSLVAALLGIFLAYRFYVQSPETPRRLAASHAGLYRLLLNRYYVDELYSAYLVAPLGALAAFLARSVERDLIDGIVEDIGRLVRGMSVAIRPVQSGYMRNYALAILFGAVVILVYSIASGRLG